MSDNENNPFENGQDQPEGYTEALDGVEDNTPTGDDVAEFDDVEVVQEQSVADPEGTNASNEDVETLPEATPATATAPAKPVKATKPPVAEGYITPVTFAHKLTEREQKAGRLAPNEQIPPQVIYSYVNQGKRPNANPATTLKSYTVGGRENLLKEDEAFAYWDAKAKRVADRAVAKAAKAQAPTAPKQEAPVEAEAKQVVEVE